MEEEINMEGAMFVLDGQVVKYMLGDMLLPPRELELIDLRKRLKRVSFWNKVIWIELIILAFVLIFLYKELLW